MRSACSVMRAARCSMLPVVGSECSDGLSVRLGGWDSIARASHTQCMSLCGVRAPRREAWNTVWDYPWALGQSCWPTERGQQTRAMERVSCLCALPDGTRKAAPSQPSRVAHGAVDQNGALVFLAVSLPGCRCGIVAIHLRFLGVLANPCQTFSS